MEQKEANHHLGSDQTIWPREIDQIRSVLMQPSTILTIDLFLVARWVAGEAGEVDEAKSSSSYWSSMKTDLHCEFAIELL